MDYKDLANLIFPDAKEISYYEEKYPERNLPEGAIVTRFAPSPTGFVHIGGLYQSLIARKLASQTNGVFFLRIEDTDQKREVENAVSGIVSSLKDFAIEPDEGMISENEGKGNYGPYKQSQRKEIYQAYAKYLIEQGKAYPCFCTPEDVEEIRAKQEAAKIRPGYYGVWAKCRTIPVEEAMKRIQNGENYIRAVDDVSFSIKEGEFIAVIGASGSGKSTLINLISGLEKPTHGCVYVHDVNLTRLSLEEQISFRRWHIGVVFQKYNLIPAMNVFENIVLPAKLLERTVDEKEVFCLAKTLGIEEKLFQMPDELSGGQQQRAAIARAVYTHPTILLGDELTGNLDSRTSASVMELLKKISRQYQQTMLVVTHDKKVAAMADRIIRMKDGRVVEDERL